MAETYSSRDLTPTRDDIERIMTPIMRQFAERLADAIEQEELPCGCKPELDFLCHYHETQTPSRPACADG